jgi:arginyl-tRNA synthetase
MNNMNIFNKVREIVINSVNQVFPEVTDTSHIAVELSKDTSHGDMATNAGLVLKNQVTGNPAEIAKKLVTILQANEIFTAVDVAGPGFINFTLNAKVWQEFLKSVILEGMNYGSNNIGQKQRVNVEYVSVNPTGLLHVGHARAIYGDVLAQLLKKCGYDVSKEYYINDAGGQINILANSAYIRYKQALGMKEEIQEGMYPGDYLIPVGEELAQKYGKDLLDMEKSSRHELISEFVVSKMMELIKQDLQAAGIVHDVFISEKHDLLKKGKIEEALALLENKNLLYKGILEPPKGKLPDDWEPREQTLFKATQFGDDIDRPIKKSDGSHTYFAGDIAYHLDKIQRGFNNMVLILGADHGGYVKRMKAVVLALSDGKASIDIKIMQLVNLFKNGQPFKMSKRAGTYITVRDLIEEVGKDVLRFAMLSRKNDTVFDFHFDKMLEQTKDNPVFYVQYAHARAHSVLRLAKEQNIEFSDQYLNQLSSAGDIELIKKIAQYPKIIESAAISHEPHRITYYLTELANEFHSYWAKGNEDEGMRFIMPKKPELTTARLYLAKALAITIASGLNILGVTPVERM